MKADRINAIESRFANWQKDCLDKDQPELAKEFVESARGDDSVEFSAKLRKHLGINEFAESASRIWEYSLPEIRTRAGFLDPPIELEQKNYNLWKKVPASQAKLPLFWTVLHIAMLEENLIYPSYFVEPKKADHSPAKDYDANVRNLMRRMGGLIKVRGHISPVTDCPTARSWWRLKLIEDAVQYCQDIDTLEAHKILLKNPIWVAFASITMTGLVVLSDPRIRASILAFLCDNKIDSKDDLKKMLHKIAELGVGKHFTTMGEQACYELVEKAWQSIQN